MAIPESQLDTWSHIGSVTQSAQTYQTIRAVLDHVDAPYHHMDYTIFLQGSYGNDTNVFRESDVDVVIRLNQTYYADTGNLNEGAKANYDRAFVRADVAWTDFRKEVLEWLEFNYGDDVDSGKKAIFVKGNGYRRDADVVVCCDFRRYQKGSTGVDDQYDEGICFWSDDIKIENFPKQHSANLTSMHQDTKQWLKPMIRVYKNMRYRMIADDAVPDGVMPSYFIEGMLWSTPNSMIGGSYKDSFMNTFNWLAQTDHIQLRTASGLHWLVHDGSRTSVSVASFNEYLAAVKNYWETWGD